MTKLKSMLSNKMFWCMVLISLSYIVMGHFIPVKPLGESLRVLQMSLAAAVVFAYWGNAIGALTCRGWPPSENLIALGIVISWFSICINGVWALMWRLSGQPAWMINNDFYNSWIALNSIAATIHILAPNLVGKGVPRADKLRLGSAWAVAAVIVAGLAWQQPDLSGFTESIRSLVEEPFELGQNNVDP